MIAGSAGGVCVKVANADSSPLFAGGSLGVDCSAPDGVAGEAGSIGPVEVAQAVRKNRVLIKMYNPEWILKKFRLGTRFLPGSPFLDCKHTFRKEYNIVLIEFSFYPFVNYDLSPIVAMKYYKNIMGPAYPHPYLRWHKDSQVVIRYSCK